MHEVDAIEGSHARNIRGQVIKHQLLWPYVLLIQELFGSQLGLDKILAAVILYLQHSHSPCALRLHLFSLIDCQRLRSNPLHMDDAVVSTIRYAQADSEALSNEKAYILNYPPPPTIPKSNFVIDFFHGIKIRSLRTANLSYRENGLAIAELPGCMPKEDFDDEEKVEKVYLLGVHRCISKTLGVEEVYIFDYMIRKREPSFPYQPGAEDNAPQPALSAHIGKPTSLNSVSQCLNRST